MSYNNTVIITGNIGAEAKEVTMDNGQVFTTIGLYTSEGYQDQNEEWKQTQSILHKVVAFSPFAMAQLKSFKAGARLKVTGSIQYRPFDVVLQDGRSVKKYEASIVAKKVKAAPLVKKTKSENKAAATV